MGVREEARRIAQERIRNDLVRDSITKRGDPVINAQLRNLSKDEAGTEQAGSPDEKAKSGEIFCAPDS